MPSTLPHALSHTQALWLCSSPPQSLLSWLQNTKLLLHNQEGLPYSLCPHSSFYQTAPPLLLHQPHVANGNPIGHSTLQQEVKKGPLNLGW